MGPGAPSAGCCGIEFDNLGSEGNHLSVLFRADLSPVMPVVPHVLTVTVAPGVEGLFVVTGQLNRWIYDMEWHPEAGETLADWPVERLLARLRASAGLPELERRDHGRFSVGLRRGGGPAPATGPGVPGRGRCPPDHSAGRHRDEHRHRRRAQPRLEAGLGRSAAGPPRRCSTATRRSVLRSGWPTPRRRCTPRLARRSTPSPTTSASITRPLRSSAAVGWQGVAHHTPG